MSYNNAHVQEANSLHAPMHQHLCKIVVIKLYMIVSILVYQYNIDRAQNTYVFIQVYYRLDRTEGPPLRWLMHQHHKR